MDDDHRTPATGSGNDRTTTTGDTDDRTTPTGDTVDRTTPTGNTDDRPTPTGADGESGEDGVHPGAARADRGDLAEYMGRQVCLGFVHHDRREWHETVASFYAVDRHQFAHLGDERAFAAATAYAAALWAKDAVEAPHVGDDGRLDREALDAADWGPVEACLSRRAEIVGMPAEYATETVEGWRRHKTGGDYWTPHMRAQQYEIRAALADPAYPPKSGNGRSGFGALPALYLVGIELHDRKSERHWERAADAMAGYYREILRAHDDDR